MLKEGFGFLILTMITSFALIIMAVIYFGITLWIIKAASTAFFGAGLEANFAVLSAALLSLGAILAGALDKK